MKSFNQSVQWHITEVCSNRCKHCYIEDTTNQERRKNELSFENLISILNNLERFEKEYNASIETFVLTGGDPFEHADFEKMLNELYLRNKNIKILGIPERISIETLAMLDKYRVISYQVSLDGMKNTHDWIRGDGSFNRTIDAIRIINKYGKVKAHIMYTLHKQNCDEMFELIDYLEAENIEASFAFDFLVLEGNAKNNCYLLDKVKVDDILDQYRRKKLQLRARRCKLVLREKVKLFETFDIDNANDKLKKYSYISGCLCGISSVAILPNGDLLPCRRLPIVVGNLLQESYTELFLKHPLMRKLRRISSYQICGICDYAKVCRGCPALAYSVTGDAFGEMVYCNKKREVIPFITEPPIDCSNDEEFEYVTNNLLTIIKREGISKNIKALQHYIYKRYLIQ